MAKPKIYKAELRLLNDKEVKQITKGEVYMTVE